MATERVRLRYIHIVSFRKSVLNNWDDFEAANRALVNELAPRDAVLFLSKRADHLVFVYGYTAVAEASDKPNGAKKSNARKVLASKHLRLQNGRWTPQLLVDYAAMVGLELEGLKRFAEQYAEAKSQR